MYICVHFSRGFMTVRKRTLENIGIVLDSQQEVRVKKEHRTFRKREQRNNNR